MGGDGTLLRIAHQFNYIDAPILGINLGHLGFMADVPVQDIFPSLADLLAGKYRIDERIMLEATSPDGKIFTPSTISSCTAAVNYSLIELSHPSRRQTMSTHLSLMASLSQRLMARQPILSPPAAPSSARRSMQWSSLRSAPIPSRTVPSCFPRTIKFRLNI